MTKIPSPPQGTGPSGRRLWTSVTNSYVLEEHEMVLLTEIVRTVDMLDALATIVKSEGLMVDGPSGTSRVHPAVVEARQLRLALARLSASLRLPVGTDEERTGNLRRPQRRGAARGVYSIRSGAS